MNSRIHFFCAFNIRAHAFAELLAFCAFTLLAFSANSAELPKITSASTNAMIPAANATATNRVIADLNLELVWIKPGTFMMGSSDDDSAQGNGERPQMTVTLTKGFWLGKTEMTQGQYEAFAGTNPSNFKNLGTNAPVEEVSWLDAMAFCQKLTEREKVAGRLPDGYAYTLPTEAQWEYACRAGSTGDYTGDIKAMSWYDENSGGTTHLVGLKQPNAWGLYDMSGNVLEWCRDWFGDYPGGTQIDPEGPKSGSFRMARGGAWRMGIQVGRSAARAGGSPGRRDYTIGLRLALCPVKE